MGTIQDRHGRQVIVHASSVLTIVPSLCAPVTILVEEFSLSAIKRAILGSRAAADYTKAREDSNNQHTLPLNYPNLHGGSVWTECPSTKEARAAPVAYSG